MKKNKGITLIALVITIIVLLILAGVALSLVAGNEGILTKAETAVSETNIAGAKEQAELMVAEISADYYEKRYVDRDATVSSQKIKDYISGQIGTAGKASSNGDYVIKVEDGKVTVSDEAGNEIASGTLEESGKVSWSETAGGSGSGGSGEGSVGETYYGDSSVVPTDQKYFTFEINEDGKTATITGIKDEYAVKGYYLQYSTTCSTNCAINDNGIVITDVVIPYEYVDENDNKYTVITLGTGVFGTNGLTSIANVVWDNEKVFSKVTLPNTIKSIDEGAFLMCEKLQKVNIPGSVTSIGGFAFSGCTSLSSINIPESVTSIGDYAFTGCTSLSSINIPDSVTTIGKGVFYECTSLSSINIPEGVTSIGGFAFSGCTSLSSINIPESVTSIGEWAFCQCTSLSSINIPESVTSIGDYAFYECTRLSSINIPDSVTSIGGWAFYGCTSLRSINIPDSVTTMGIRVFEGWTASQTINCQAASVPSGWGTYWESDCKAVVNWGVSM